MLMAQMNDGLYEVSQEMLVNKSKEWNLSEFPLTRKHHNRNKRGKHVNETS